LATSGDRNLAVDNGAAAGAAGTAPEVVLLLGEELLIRPVVAADTDAMAASFERLSPPSRRSRFFTGVQRLSQTHLAYLTRHCRYPTCHCWAGHRSGTPHCRSTSASWP